MLSLKKIYVFQSRKGNLFELPNSGIYFSIINYYVTNIVNYFVLFFNVLDLYIFLLNDIDVITSKKQTWKVIKVFIIIITIIIIAMFET